MVRAMMISTAARGLVLCCALWPLQGPASTANAPAADEAAASALVFEEQLDGKCQILSQGGKLVVLRNTHPARPVRYRLVRMFLDTPQGRLDGQIAPADAPQKLGCNRVNGRRQYWRVERATLVAEPQETP